MKKFLFMFLQFTWGLLINIYGLGVYVFCTIKKYPKKKMGPYTIFYSKGLNGGLNAGLIICIGEDCENCIPHEMGHGIQNIIFGPLMPFLVTIPSAIRYWYRTLLEIRYYSKYLDLPDYDSIWFEHQATSWGTKYFEKKFK